jgi:hypothetical protein
MTDGQLAIRAPRAGDGEGLARCWIDAGVTTARRQGVVTRLLTAVEAWALARGARFVLLDTGEDNAIAIDFHERRMGYWRRARRYRKELV